MPIFEYQCKKCEEIFEELVLKDEDIPRKCPKCGSKIIKKLFSPANDIWKCPGSYKGDNK